MDAIEEIETFSDKEVAYFMKYCLRYIEPVLKIRLENYIIHQRGIDPIYYKKLINTKINHNNSAHCSRCGSIKIIKTTNQKICLICGKVQKINILLRLINNVLDAIPI